jgi:hypothetical protein
MMVINILVFPLFDIKYYLSQYSKLVTTLCLVQCGTKLKLRSDLNGGNRAS